MNNSTNIVSKRVTKKLQDALLQYQNDKLFFYFEKITCLAIFPESSTTA